VNVVHADRHCLIRLYTLQVSADLAGADHGGRAHACKVRAGVSAVTGPVSRETRSYRAVCHCREAEYGRALAPYLEDPSNLFIISSDFCHWGDRFTFTFYDEHHVRRPWPCAACLDVCAHSARHHRHEVRGVQRECPLADWLAYAGADPQVHRVAGSCRHGHHRVGELATLLSTAAHDDGDREPDAYGVVLRNMQGNPDNFTRYLQQFGNTICGRHPIGVLLQVQSACAAGVLFNLMPAVRWCPLSTRCWRRLCGTVGCATTSNSPSMTSPADAHQSRIPASAMLLQLSRQLDLQSPRVLGLYVYVHIVVSEGRKHYRIMCHEVGDGWRGIL
jgi:Memo-like protein